MSGPVTTADDAPAEGGCGDTAPDVELIPSREAEVGRFRVRRALPRIDTDPPPWGRSDG